MGILKVFNALHAKKGENVLERKIDINCDLGESFGLYRYGADQEVMPLISSANVACGFHAGDPHVIRETVDLAVSCGVRIGAHIGFPDRLGFGRREIKVTPQEVYDYIIYQLGALDGFLKIANVTMSHIKLHGALYMMACEHKEISRETVRAVKEYNPKLEIYALPHSELAKQGKQEGLKVVNEFFADRPYNKKGVKMFDWSLEEIGSPTKVADNVLNVLEQDLVKGKQIDTICVHGDTPNAPSILSAIRENLMEAGWCVG